jgi:probable rRNA maturation factor
VTGLETNCIRMSFEIDIQNRQSAVRVDIEALQAVLKLGLAIEQVESAVLSVTIVGDLRMQELNRTHLGHDYPTDVISFPLEHSVLDAQNDTDQAVVAGEFPAAGAHIEGEIVVSADTAATVAKERGAATGDELNLYAIHGMLHICGYDDQCAADEAIMRSREAAILNGPDSGTSCSSQP